MSGSALLRSHTWLSIVTARSICYVEAKERHLLEKLIALHFVVVKRAPSRRVVFRYMNSRPLEHGRMTRSASNDDLMMMALDLV